MRDFLQTATTWRAAACAYLLCVLVSGGVLAQDDSPDVDMIGEASIEIADDFEAGRSEIRYFLIDPDRLEQTQVFFTDAPDAAFRTGNMVRVYGWQRADGRGVDVDRVELLVPGPDMESADRVDRSVSDDEAGETAQAPIATPETRKVVTILVSFNDADVDLGPDGSPTAYTSTASDLKSIMFNDPKNVSHFYDTASLGTLTIPPDPNGIGQEAVFGPYTINDEYMTGNSSDCTPSTWADLALTEWENDPSNSEIRSDYRHWNFIVPNYLDYTRSNGRVCSWGGVAQLGCGSGCYAFSADPVHNLFAVIIHELGHTLTFNHARTDTDNDGSEESEYGDASDLMGSARNWMKFNAPHFDYKGWWDPVTYEIQTITPSSTLESFDLIPVDEEDGPWPGLRAVKTARTSGSSYYFTYRQQTGYYDAVTSSYTTGVNLHWRLNGTGSFYPYSNSYSYFYRMIDAGETFIDQSNDLYVRGIGSMPVSNGSETTNAFTIEICNLTCDSLVPPLNLDAAGAEPDTILLTWEDYTYNEDGFEIDRSPDGSTWSQLATTGPNATSYFDAGLTSNTTYYYRVRAFRGGSELSPWSNTASATTPAASGTFTYPIITGDDDVAEVQSNGTILQDWSYIYLGFDTLNSILVDGGFRFQDVTIPQGATINSAHVEFRAYAGSGTNTLTLQAEDSADAAPFTGSSHEVSSRTFVTGSVSWPLPSSWCCGNTHQTPDISTLIQPIVDRADWSGGNSMVIYAQTPSTTATHRVRTYDYGSSSAAKLVVDYDWTAPPPDPPVASFTYSTYSLDASFTDTSTDSDGNVVSWSWDFGDGSGTSTAQHPTYTYAASDTYTVTLTVTDNEGGTDSTSQSVTVVEDTTPPVITILGSNPTYVKQGSTYGAAEDAGATAQDDLDGDVTASIVTTGLPVDTSTLGNKTVTYTVSDGSGNTASADRTVTVQENLAPTAGFTYSTIDLTVNFTDTSTDSDGTIAAWSWDFGDASGTSTAQNPSYTYAATGTYTVTLTVTDDDGATDDYSEAVSVAEPPPAAPSSLTATAVSNSQVDLAWTDNATNEDGFVIERSPDGSAWAPAGTTGMNTTTYRDEGLSGSTTYYYQVKATNSGGDSGYSNTANDTTFTDCSHSKTYMGGMWYQFGLPCNPQPDNTVADIFEGASPWVWRQDPATSTYVPLDPTDTMSAGIGYWVLVEATATMSVDGYPHAEMDLPLVADSTGRMNLVGYFRNDDPNMVVHWPDVMVVSSNGQTQTILEADPEGKGQNAGTYECDLDPVGSKCIVRRIAYMWDGSGAYQTYDASHSDPALWGTIESGQSLWVEVFAPDYDLRFPAAVAESAPATVRAPAENGTDGTAQQGNGKGQDKKKKASTWFVRLRVESGSLSDGGNSFGQSPRSVDGLDSQDLEELAPPANTYLTVLFTNPLLDQVPWGYTTDFRAATKGYASEWPFLVRTSAINQPVTLYWENVGVPLDNAWLVNEQTGERIAVNEGESYTFTPVANDSFFTFELE